MGPVSRARASTCRQSARGRAGERLARLQAHSGQRRTVVRRLAALLALATCCTALSASAGQDFSTVPTVSITWTTTMSDTAATSEIDTSQAGSWSFSRTEAAAAGEASPGYAQPLVGMVSTPGTRDEIHIDATCTGDTCPSLTSARLKVTGLASASGAVPDVGSVDGRTWRPSMPGMFEVAVLVDRVAASGADVPAVIWKRPAFITPTYVDVLHGAPVRTQVSTTPGMATFYTTRPVRAEEFTLMAPALAMGLIPATSSCPTAASGPSAIDYGSGSTLCAFPFRMSTNPQSPPPVVAANAYQTTNGLTGEDCLAATYLCDLPATFPSRLSAAGGWTATAPTALLRAGTDLYVADTGNNVVRVLPGISAPTAIGSGAGQIDLSAGRVVAGNGAAGADATMAASRPNSATDKRPATTVALDAPQSLAKVGNTLYIGERRGLFALDLTTSTLTRVLGSDTSTAVWAAGASLTGSALTSTPSAPVRRVLVPSGADNPYAVAGLIYLITAPWTTPGGVTETGKVAVFNPATPSLTRLTLPSTTTTLDVGAVSGATVTATPVSAAWDFDSTSHPGRFYLSTADLVTGSTARNALYGVDLTGTATPDKATITTLTSALSYAPTSVMVTAAQASPSVPALVWTTGLTPYASDNASTGAATLKISAWTYPTAAALSAFGTPATTSWPAAFIPVGTAVGAGGALVANVSAAAADTTTPDAPSTVVLVSGARTLNDWSPTRVLTAAAATKRPAATTLTLSLTGVSGTTLTATAADWLPWDPTIRADVAAGSDQTMSQRMTGDSALSQLIERGDIVQRITQNASGVTSSYNALGYDETNCGDGWKSTDGGLTFSAGLEGFCSSTGDFLISLARAFASPTLKAASSLTGPCTPGTAQAAAANSLVAAGILTADDVAFGGSGATCKLGLPLRKMTAYRLLARVVAPVDPKVGGSATACGADSSTWMQDLGVDDTLPDSQNSSYRDAALADPHLGSFTAPPVSCSEVYRLLALGVPNVGSAVCPAGAVDNAAQVAALVDGGALLCFRPYHAMTRADVAELLGALYLLSYHPEAARLDNLDPDQNGNAGLLGPSSPAAGSYTTFAVAATPISAPRVQLAPFTASAPSTTGARIAEAAPAGTTSAAPVVVDKRNDPYLLHLNAQVSDSRVFVSAKLLGRATTGAPAALPSLPFPWTGLATDGQALTLASGLTVYLTNPSLAGQVAGPTSATSTDQGVLTRDVYMSGTPLQLVITDTGTTAGTYAFAVAACATTQPGRADVAGQCHTVVIYVKANS